MAIGPLTSQGAGSPPGDEVEFDPFSAVYFNDPYDVYRRLRNEAPVYRNDQYGFWALSRWDDVTSAHKRWQALSSRYGTDLSMLSEHRPTNLDLIIFMDPPKHDRMRALVSRVFTPKAVAALEPMIREVIGETLGRCDREAGFDAVADFAAIFPIEVISRMLGVPPGERQQVRHWIDLMLHREPGQLHPTQQGNDAAFQSALYFFELAEAKRANPQDDMLSRLTQVEVDRGDGETTALTDEEIAGFASLLGGAGAETVTKLLGNAMVLFARHPQQWRTVVESPASRPAAVEEILRYYPPSQYQGRFALEDIALHGQTIPAGSPVLLLTGAATRDERHFDDPDRFDISRRGGLALGFGYGIHSCLGAALARMESTIALEMLSRRLPVIDVDEAALQRVHMSNVAGYSRVPVRAGQVNAAIRGSGPR